MIRTPRIAWPALSRVLLALGLAAALAARASAAPPGFAFLEIPAGARLSALGGAGATFASGIEGMFWNPAALEGAEKLTISGSHFEMFEGLRHDDFAIGGPALGGGLAASMRALYSGTIDERDELGNLIGGFGAHDLEFAIGYGARAGAGLSLGGSARLVRERIADRAAQTYAFGLGARWEPAAVAGLRLALSGHNLGPAAAYTFDGVKGAPVGLPAAVQAGASMGWTVGNGLALRTGAEARLTRGRTGVGIAAAELAGLAGTALRGGLRVNDSAANVSLGLGYALTGLDLDYAWVPSRLDLEDTHRVSFRATF